MKRLTRFVVFGGAAAALCLFQPYRVAMVDGASMNPTFESGQLLVTSRITSHLRHGDVVVFKHDGETFVKRVAFLPGDRIFQFKFMGDWISPMNDFVLATSKLKRMPRRAVTIPDGNVFVLGDNPYGSIDSRSFGTISTADILGKVIDDPRPEMIRGYSGSEQIDDETDMLTVRSQPLAPKDQLRAKSYLARLDRIAKRGTRAN